MGKSIISKALRIARGAALALAVAPGSALADNGDPWISGALAAEGSGDGYRGGRLSGYGLVAPHGERNVEMIGTRTKRLARDRTLMLGLLAVVLVVLTLIAARPAHAETFTVNSTGNAGVESADGICDSNITATITCTLREAIQESNASTTANDTINFAIPGSDGNCNATTDVCTISPTSQLPIITDRVFINGYTQSGAVANTATTNANNAVLKVEINGAGAGAGSSGLLLSGEEARGTFLRGLVINRFGGDGVFAGAGVTVAVEGNFIGADPSGAIDRGNGLNGVRAASANNRIGGSANEAQNVISGNGTNGVAVLGSGSTGNVVSNNHIGTDADAGADLGNSLSGVFATSPGVIVGGDDANGANGAGQDNGDVKGEGNIISGNDQSGVLIDNIGASGTKVLGNLIGLNRNGSGSSNVGNTRDGVRVSSAPQVEIGGTLDGQGNTISDNGDHGVEIVGTSSTFVKVLGNHIGTDFNGSSDVGNTLDGVHLGNAGNTTIGGTSAGARNVISGNDANGVFISGTDTATSNRVDSNFIGTDVNGTSDLGNGELGVRVETPGNFIGSAAANAGNVISGNGGVGVGILATDVSDASGNRILGNLIGSYLNGNQASGGNFQGVFISNAPGNLVGGIVAGTGSGASNTISGNANNGVMVIGDSATGNRILNNSIFDNGDPNGLGIALNNDSVTANDAGDADTGPNNLQNFPTLNSAANSGGTRIQGDLDSTPNQTFTIQFFSNPAPNDPTGFGEGETFLGETTVTTNASGFAPFTFTSQFALPEGQLIAATATKNSTGDTSEFSQAKFITTNAAPVADNDAFTATEDATLNVPAPGVLAGDTDSDPLVVTDTDSFEPGVQPAAQPSNGTLTLNANGSFAYAPNANFNGTDSFAYRANDGTSESNAATVTITVNPVNDAPQVTRLAPAPNSRTRAARPRIGATVNDMETNLAKSNVKLFVDGKKIAPKSFSYDRATDRLSFTPKAALGAGRHTVKVVATDAQNKSVTKQWAFEVIR